ncbi:hypothetical protein T08_1574, partial [Trichinella sp. T8]
MKCPFRISSSIKYNLATTKAERIRRPKAQSDCSVLISGSALKFAQNCFNHSVLRILSKPVVCTAQMCILGDLNNKIASCIPSNVFHGQFSNVSSSEHVMYFSLSFSYKPSLKVSFGRIAAPPEQIQGTYAEPRFSSLDKYFYSLHRLGRTYVFNYDSTVIKKDQLFSTLRFHLQYLRQLKKNAKNAFYMADKQEMYPLQFHK